MAENLIDLHDLVAPDVDRAVGYISRDNPRAGRRFLSELKATLEFLASMPEIGTLYESDNPAFKGLRYFWVSSRFRNYVIYYLPKRRGIKVLRILHGSQDTERILENMPWP